jgi:hypothetical protein
MKDLQFFPTPRWLAEYAWGKFKNREFTRVLDPSAGEGALLEAMPRDWRGESLAPVDCIEIDVSKHPTLHDKGHKVVGLDFLNFDGGVISTQSSTGRASPHG